MSFFTQETWGKILKLALPLSVYVFLCLIEQHRIDTYAEKQLSQAATDV